MGLNNKTVKVIICFSLVVFSIILIFLIKIPNNDTETSDGEDILFKQRLANYQREYLAYRSRQLVTQILEYNVDTMDIKAVIPSFTDEDRDIVVIHDGKLKIKSDAPKDKLKAAELLNVEIYN